MDIIIPDGINTKLFKYLISLYIDRKEIKKEELKSLSYKFLTSIEPDKYKTKYNFLFSIEPNEPNEYKIELSEIEESRIIKRFEKVFSRTLTYMKKLNIIDNNRRKEIKRTKEFENIINEKSNVIRDKEFLLNKIIKTLIEKKYDILFKNEKFLTRQEVIEFLLDKYKNKIEKGEVNKQSIIKYGNMLFNTINLLNNSEKSDLYYIITNSDKRSGISKVKNELIKFVLNKMSNLDSEEKKHLRKILKETKILELTYKELYNNDILNMISAITNDPTLSSVENFYKTIPNMEKGKNKIEEYIKSGKNIIFVSDTDNDGTAGKSIVDLLEESLGLSNIHNLYAVPSEKTKHGISYEQIKKYIEENNLKDDILIVTIDNGANNLEEINNIIKNLSNKNRKIEMIITDHHKPEYSLDDIKNKNITIINQHFRKDKEDKYEPSGAETFGVIAKEIVKDLLEDESVKSAYIAHINNIIAFSDIADMVKSQSPIFLRHETREEIGKNVNKLNSISTFETFLNKIYSNELEEYLSNFLFNKNLNNLINNEKEIINKYKDNILLIEKYGKVLKDAINLLQNKDKNNEKNIINFIDSHLLNIENIKLNKKTEYSNLYEIRPYIVKLITKPVLTPEEDFLLKHFRNILNLIKEIEKSLKLSFNEKELKIFENKNSKIIYSPKKNRKLINKLIAGTYNGILIMLDKYVEKEDQLQGSIRILNKILFEDLLNKNIDNPNGQKLLINSINGTLKNELKSLGINIKIRGHETGAAGIIIENISKGIKLLGWDGKEENKEKYINKLLEKLNDKLDIVYNNLLKKQKINEINIPLNRIEDIKYINDVFNILKYNNFTHGNKPVFNVTIPLTNLKIVEPETKTKHIKVPTISKDEIIKFINYLEKLDINYLTSVISLDNENLIINKNDLINALKSQIKLLNKTIKKEIVLKFNSISPTSFFSKGSELSKIKQKYVIENNNKKRVKNYSEYFNKNNNYTVEFNSVNEFLSKIPLFYNEEKIRNFVGNVHKELINSLNVDEHVIVDVEGIGFGKNNNMFNIQFHRITKENKVITHSFLIDLEKEMNLTIPPAISHLTGIDEEIIRKESVSIEFISNFLNKIFENKKILLTAHNNTYDKLSMATTLKGKIVEKILNSPDFIWYDSAAIARNENLVVPNQEENYTAKIKFKINNKTYINLGKYYLNNKPYSFYEFLKNPFDNKIITSEDNKKLIIKEEGNQYIVYLIDEVNSKPLKLGNVEKLLDNKNINFSLQKNRKYSVDRILTTIGSEIIYSKYNQLNTFNDIDLNNIIKNTGILDIDKLIQNIKENFEFVISFNNTMERNEFIKENIQNIKNNFDFTLIPFLNKIKSKNNIDININKNNIEKEFIFSLNEEEKNKIFTKTELKTLEKLEKNLFKDKEQFDNFFNKLIKKKKFINKYLPFFINKVKEELLNKENNIKTELIKKFRLDNNIDLDNFLNQIYNKVSDFYIENLIIDKFSNIYESEIKIKNLEDNNIDKILEIILNEIYINLNPEKFIDQNIIKKLLFENGNIENDEETIKRFKQNHYNFIPDSVLKNIIKVSKTYFEEIKRKDIDNFLEKNYYDSIYELLKEGHNNVNPYTSDTGYEVFDIFVGLLISKKINQLPYFYEAIMNEELKQLKLNYKGVQPNTFSFKQLLDILENKKDISPEENIYLNKQIDYIINEYNINKRIPIKIENSKYIMFFKPKEKLELKNSSDILKYRKLFNFIESQINTIYSMKKIINYFKFDKGLITIFQEEINKILKNINEYGDFSIIEVNIDTFINNLKETKKYNKDNGINIKHLKVLENKLKETNFENYNKKKELKDYIVKEILKELPSFENIILHFVDKKEKKFNFEKAKKYLEKWFYIIKLADETLIKYQIEKNLKIENIETMNNSATISKTIMDFIRNIIENNISYIDYNANIQKEEKEKNELSNYITY